MIVKQPGLAIVVPLVTCVLAFAAASGCSKPVRLVPAEGVVEIDGKAAEGIVIQFLPQASDGENRPSSFATTGPDGKFSLLTHAGKPGAVEGTHAVILVDTQEERPAQGTRATKPPRLDSKYATVSGGLTATVAENGGPIIVRVPGTDASP